MEDRCTIDTTGPYIPISQCITGKKMQSSPHPFIFDRLLLERSSKSNQMYKSLPQIDVLNADFSKFESNSNDDCNSMSASHSVMDGWTAASSFSRLHISPRDSDVIETNGPPVPPRPPKTLSYTRTEAFQGPRMQEPSDNNNVTCLLVPRRSSRRISPVRQYPCVTEDDEKISPHHSMQYFNMLPLPPLVNRELKPKTIYTRRLHNDNITVGCASPSDASPTLQYHELTLHTTKPQNQTGVNRKTIQRARSASLDEGQPDYTTVDPVKTQALFITRQDAEALRNTQKD